MGRNVSRTSVNNLFIASYATAMAQILQLESAWHVSSKKKGLYLCNWRNSLHVLGQIYSWYNAIDFSLRERCYPSH